MFTLNGPYVANAVSDLVSSQAAGSRLLKAALILFIASTLLFLFNRLIELVTPKVAQRADVITTPENVMRLRRAETFISLSITIVRVFVVVAALFVIWQISHPGAHPVALIGVGTVVVVLAGATVVPLLRDVTYGFIMIAEKWYGVGDHVVIEPMAGSGGVVEKITLRATKLRSVNGEAIWVHHQHIQGVRVTSAASHPLAIETFVSDPKLGRKVVEDAITVIPISPTTVPQPPTITEVKQISDSLWRITAICEVTPFREWIIDNFAVKVIKKTDLLTGKDPVIVHGPIVYYADATAEKRYQRSATVRKRVRAASSAARP